MKKNLFFMMFLLLALVCNCQKKERYTFEEFKAKFQSSFEIGEIPIGTYFWDEFCDYETQYNLTKNESKLLGWWMPVLFTMGPTYNNYVFLPNKLFISPLKFRNFQEVDDEKIFFDKAIGTWEIIDSIVCITIYAIITEDMTLKHPEDKGLFFVEKPYSFDFININDIGEEGYTCIPINNAVTSSKEFKRMVKIIEPNRTNNLYVRNIYTIDFYTKSGQDEKNYNYFKIVPNLARENLTGLEVATNAELIEKYIFPLWP